MLTVTGHFVPRSFRTSFGHFVPTFWSFRTNIRNDLKPCSCAQFAPGRELIYTRVQICTPLCRVHMPINCMTEKIVYRDVKNQSTNQQINGVHTRLDLIRNLIQVTHFRRNSLCLNVLNDSSCIISVYVC